MVFQGEVKSFKFSDRVLTPAEMAKSAAVCGGDESDPHPDYIVPLTEEELAVLALGRHPLDVAQPMAFWPLQAEAL